MAKLTQYQEDLLFEIVDHMVRCNQHSFSTIWGDGQISIMFEPTHDNAECNQYIDRDAEEVSTLEAVGTYFRLKQHGEGDYVGTLTGEAEELYDQLSRERILKKLKAEKDTDPGYEFTVYTAGTFDISQTSRYEDNVQDLLDDDSIAENTQMRGIVTTARGLYITRRGEQRLKTGILDLDQEPVPPAKRVIQRGMVAPANNTYLPEQDFSFIRSAKLREVATRDYEELRIVATVAASKSTMLLCGAIIEVVLADKIRLRWKTKAQRIADLYYGETNTAKKPKPLLNWQLEKLISVAVGLGILTSSASTDTSAIQEYRNLVHPLREVREGASINQATAGIMLNLLQLVLQHLAAKKGKRPS